MSETLFFLVGLALFVLQLPLSLALGWLCGRKGTRQPASLLVWILFAAVGLGWVAVTGEIGGAAIPAVVAEYLLLKTPSWGNVFPHPWVAVVTDLLAFLTAYLFAVKRFNARLTLEEMTRK